ncbi:cytochrome P450 [Pontivivens ytuae]|uniref:Cytochrome P450 n=1 Tax=Pontivivens ytuae TaxID=2789856 RepID=A0A7S9LV11_9RHOB|nr:cytochrome P450 [Pontivivens ytuae]QPH55663.1 cytochrome P450 [Pontivivens ytuae]
MTTVADAIPKAPPRAEGEGDIAYLARLQAMGPLLRNGLGMLMTFSHADLLYIVDDARTRQMETELLAMRGITSGPLHEFFSHSLLMSNGDAHRRRRTPVARTFAYSLMNAMRGEIREIAEDLVRPTLNHEIDFAEGVSGPLPARLIARILGVPDGDVPHFSQLVYSAMRGLSVRSDAVTAEASRDMGELGRYVEGLLAERRARPQDDVLSAYIERTADGPLDALEVRIQIVTLILAGADTTRLALAATFARLLRNPAQWAALVADPEGMKAGAAAEGLRYDPVVASLPRVVTTPFELHGRRIREGELVMTVLISALRDPEVYAEPERFDIARTDHPKLHPIFGAGPHRCLGEALARAELEEALAVLARLAPAARLIGPPPELRGFSAVRTLAPLHIAMS